MLYRAIPVVEGYLVNCTGSSVEAMGNIDINVEARPEIDPIIEDELGSASISKLGIETVPAVRLLDWGEYPCYYHAVGYAGGNLHLVLKEFMDGCLHGFRVISDIVLLFQVFNVIFSYW